MKSVAVASSERNVARMEWVSRGSRSLHSAQSNDQLDNKTSNNKTRHVYTEGDKTRGLARHASTTVYYSRLAPVRPPGPHGLP